MWFLLQLPTTTQTVLENDRSQRPRAIILQLSSTLTKQTKKEKKQIRNLLIRNDQHGHLTMTRTKCQRRA